MSGNNTTLQNVLGLLSILFSIYFLVRGCWELSEGNTGIGILLFVFAIVGIAFKTLQLDRKNHDKSD
ncbi:MAG: hypothetical protein RL757_2124 [Bacteroidota bacterium]